ncbi:MAG TPA: nucleotidyltransferase family protein [Pyrinomonadaceae bacterium]|jgi:CTP:molybdopterin cytidylyltransferase MocA
MVAAILLAAGRSRRMGAFKPLLPFPRERTVAEACIENLRGAGVGEIVVVVGHRAAEMRERLAHLGVRFATNAEAESEMGVSIARGVELVSDEADAVLVALVDTPAVAPESIRKVIEARRRERARLVVPTFAGRGGHPVLVGLEFREALLHLDAEKGLRALFEAHAGEVLRLEVASPYIARDMDTWEDYRALYAEIFGYPPTLEPTHE